MKNILIAVFTLVALTSCKKNNPEKAFLRGQLLDQCDGNPVANTTLYFYQDFTPSTNWLLSDTEESLLETATTDENGYFEFWGEDYTHNKTSSISNSSIRLNHDTKLFTGSLGKGDTDEQVNGELLQNAGTMFSTGANLNFDLLLDTLYENTILDSIILSVYPGDLQISLSDKSSGAFEHNFNGVYQFPLYYTSWESEKEFKHQFLVFYSLFSGGSSIEYSSQYLYIDKCANSGEVHLEF